MKLQVHVINWNLQKKKCIDTVNGDGLWVESVEIPQHKATITQTMASVIP